MKDDKLMQEATQALARNTRSVAVAATDEGDAWRWGYPHVYRNPEFSDEVCQHVFSAIEEAKRLHELFFERMTGVSPVEVIFGEDLGWSGLDYISVAGTRFSVRGRECALGIVGPSRLRYSAVIPVLRYFRGLIQEIAGA